MDESSKFLVNNGESELWMKQLVLSYFSRHPKMWLIHTAAMIIDNEVEYDGHMWRAIPYSSPTTYPRLELKSNTTTTRVAVPVDVAIKLLASLNKEWEQNLWTQKSTLVCMCNASVKDQL